MTIEITSSRIRPRLKELLAEVASAAIDPQDIPDEGVIDSVGVDSVMALEFLVSVEGEFGFEIADEDLSVDLVDSLIVLNDYIERALSAA